MKLMADGKSMNSFINLEMFLLLYHGLVSVLICDFSLYVCLRLLSPVDISVGSLAEINELDQTVEFIYMIAIIIIIIIIMCRTTPV